MLQKYFTNCFFLLHIDTSCIIVQNALLYMPIICVCVCVCVCVNIYTFSLVSQSCPTLCDPINHSTLGLPVHHQLPESTQAHVHRVGDAIQPFHLLSTPSPPALNLFQHQGLFKWVSSSIRWPKYWSFSFNISPSNEHPGLIHIRICICICTYNTKLLCCVLETNTTLYINYSSIKSFDHHIQVVCNIDHNKLKN